MIIPINKSKSTDILSGLTSDQKTAYENIIKFINEPYNPNNYKIALSGAAGTGKTYLIKLLLKNSNLSYSQINLAAPTHKAVRVLGEAIQLPVVLSTMASDLGFRPNYDSAKFDIKNPPFDPKGKVKLLDRKPLLYIMDEASMIGRGELYYIEKFCKQINCKILFIGDATQLPPVNETYSPAFKGLKLYELKQIVRQGEDNPVSRLLEILRYDVQHKTFYFIKQIKSIPYKMNEDNTKGYMTVNTTDFNKIVYEYFNDEKLTENVDLCKLIAYTNSAVNGWNNVIRQSIIKDSNKAVLTKHDLLISYTNLVDSFNSSIINNSEDYIIHDIVNYTHPTYSIKGFMIRLKAIHGGKVTSPIFVMDHSDAFSVKMYLKISNELLNTAKNASASGRSAAWKAYFKFKEGCLLLTNIVNAKNEILFSRDLDYGFALTAHKSQGSTFNNVFVDVDDIVFDKFGMLYSNIDEINRRLYVACSRCKDKLILKYNH